MIAYDASKSQGHESVHPGWPVVKPSAYNLYTVFDMIIVPDLS